MPMNLPSNVPIEPDGVVRVTIFHGHLRSVLEARGYNLKDFRGPESGVKLARLWAIELQKRLPNSVLEFTVSPGELPAQITASTNHKDSAEAIKRAIRIGHFFLAKPENWIVYANSPDARAIVNEYRGTEVGYVDGREEEDSAGDGSGDHATGVTAVLQTGNGNAKPTHQRGLHPSEHMGEHAGSSD